MTERRRFARASILGTATATWDRLHVATYLVANLSAGGARLFGTRSIPVGTRTEIVINLGPRRVFRIEATVSRLHVRAPGDCDVAVAFVGAASEVADAVQRSVLAELETAHVGDMKCALVVVPADADRQMLTRDLHTLGRSAFAIATPREAVEYAAHPKARLDVALVELAEECAQGIDFLVFVGDRHPHARRVILAADINEHLARAREFIGDCTLLRKPWNLPELARAPRRLSVSGCAARRVVLTDTQLRFSPRRNGEREGASDEVELVAWADLRGVCRTPRSRRTHRDALPSTTPVRSRADRVPAPVHRDAQRDVLHATAAAAIATCSNVAHVDRAGERWGRPIRRPVRRGLPSWSSPSCVESGRVNAANHDTPPDRQAVTDDDLDGPTSAVRPHLAPFAIPWLAVTAAGLRSLPLDARMAYLLSLVDGHCTVEEILDISEPEVERDEALGILARLLQLGAIKLRDP